MNGDNVWKWIAGALLTVSSILAGGFLGDWRASNDIDKVEAAVYEHRVEPGHSVALEKIQNIEDQLSRIERKLDQALQ
jgi:hypothetical protein